MMKIKTIMYSTILSLLSLATQAGQSIDSPVIIDMEQMAAFGSMKTARYSENENALLGCGTRTLADSGGGIPFKFGFCQASIDGISENNAFCSTENAALINEIDSLNNNDFVTFRWDADGFCTHVGNSTQSQYIPANKSESKKVKKGDD